MRSAQGSSPRSSLGRCSRSCVVAVPRRRSQPGDTEHGVNRAKLAAKAERMIEERNGIEVLKISKCGPQQAQGQAQLLDLGLHVARRGRLRRARSRTTAPARRSGSASEAAGGSTRARTGCSRWRRCSTSPNPPPIFGFNDNWIFQSAPALDLLDEPVPASPARACRGAGVEPTPRRLQLVRLRRALRRSCSTRGHPAAVGAHATRPAARSPTRARAQSGNDQLHPAPAVLRRVRRVRRRRREALPGRRSGSRSGTSPTTRRFWGGPPEPGDVRRDAEDGRRRAAQRGARG